MLPLPSLPVVLAATGAALAVLGFVLTVVGGRRRKHALQRELDKLHDEVWELREAAAGRDRAEAANEAKSRFLASVSHEVRTPLNGILGMAELLAGTRLEPEQQTYVGAIRSSGSALASLIDEILDLSKIEAGKVELLSEAFDVTALVEGVAELLAPRAQGKGLEIASRVAADVPQRVIGDPVRLRQVLLNVAGNAVKFTECGGVGITVGREPGGDGRLRFEVLDTGPGIPAGRRDAIFEDFEQADATDERLHGGTGLGLAISKRLVERMGGALALEADATPRSGARFSIVVPLPADGEAEPRPASSCADIRSALIVADSPFQAPFVAEQLRGAGVCVTLAADPAQARRAFAEHGAFDVVIADCAFGQAEAASLAAAARAAGTTRTLVLFSPFERRGMAGIAVSGFDGWLVKPVRRQSLFAMIAADRADTTGPVALQRPGSASFTVLLAEDNEINALLATRTLQKLGASVTHAPDGLAALSLFEAALEAGEAFDVAVLDQRMPGLSGLELARRMRRAETAKDARRCRLIISSADQLPVSLATAQAGVDAVLGKPITYAKLRLSLGLDAAEPAPTRLPTRAGDTVVMRFGRTAR